MVGAWACYAAIFASALAILTRVPSLVLLWRGSASTEGAVTNVDSANHGATTVRYTVGAIQYEKTFPPQNLHRGDRPTVYYRPAEPETAAMEAPAVALRHSLALCGIGAILFGTLFMAAARHPRAFQAANPGRVVVPGSPRAAVTVVALFFLVGALFNLLGGPLPSKRALSITPEFSGCGMLAYQAFRHDRDAAWRTLLRSKLFVCGVSLIIVAQLVEAL
jgi:hypothetical protein